MTKKMTTQERREALRRNCTTIMEDMNKTIDEVLRVSPDDIIEGLDGFLTIETALKAVTIARMMQKFGVKPEEARNIMNTLKEAPEAPTTDKTKWDKKDYN